MSSTGLLLRVDPAMLAGLLQPPVEPTHLPRVKDLIGAITRFIDGWNDRCEPFVWTKTADQIVSHSRSQKTSFTRH